MVQVAYSASPLPLSLAPWPKLNDSQSGDREDAGAYLIYYSLLKTKTKGLFLQLVAPSNFSIILSTLSIPIGTIHANP